MNDFQHILEGISRSFAPVVPVQADIDPGEGYRMLRPDELVMVGDEFSIGGVWGAVVKTEGTTLTKRSIIRRPIWRILASDEPLQAGDECRWGTSTEWEQVSEIHKGKFPAHWKLPNLEFRRKTEGS